MPEPSARPVNVSNALRALGYSVNGEPPFKRDVDEANIFALLSLEGRLGEQVEQQRLANVLAAIGRTELLDWETEQAAAAYVRARIGDIVQPGESDA